MMRRAFAVLALAASSLAAASGPATTEVLRDDARWRVVSSTYPPGTTGPRHSHRWPRVIYVLEGGVVRLTGEDGTAVEVTLETGQLLERGPETHAVANIGNTTVRVLETEAKTAPIDQATGDGP